MIEKLNDPLMLAIVVIPGILISLNAFLKNMGMPSKFAPLVNLIGGFVAIFPLRELGLAWLPAIIGSLIVGLSAGGFYDLKRITDKNVE